MNRASFIVEAPGRLCLFGEHQDYLNLPVIASSLPLKCRIHVQPDAGGRVLTLRVPVLNQVKKYNLDQLPPRQGVSSATTAKDFEPDFALASIYEALDDGWTFESGADCESTTDIPLQAGCSSSSAFCVAWSLVLARLAGHEKELLDDPIKLAQRAHRAEVTHFGAPGGTMDHVTSAVGGLLRIGPDPWAAERFKFDKDREDCWVLAYSGDPKDTFGHLHRCKNARLKLLDKLNGDWDADTSGIELTEDEQSLLSATLVNRDMERKAAEVLRGGSASGQELGKMMQRHHEALRDGLLLSTAALDKLMKAAIDEGAYGFKVVGSGGGGCGVAWTSKEKATKVKMSMHDAGASQVWVIESPGTGAGLFVGN